MQIWTELNKKELKLRTIALGFLLPVARLSLERKIWGSNPGPAKSDILPKTKVPYDKSGPASTF